ncbi:MAG: phosphoenolpyruvate--protein phosphotransferase [Chloroflexales bacterium]|nr:phosphoenolpyruvate--protein phosphotransferase [Chloroflexales bacterium]
MTVIAPGLRLYGVAAAPGLAVGPVRRFDNVVATVAHYRVDDVGDELVRLLEARRQARAELAALQVHVTTTVSAEEAGIFEAHIAFLDDAQLFDEVEAHCHAESCNAEAAVAAVLDGYRAVLAASEDELFRARANDLEDIKERLIRLLSGTQPATDLLGDTPCIVVADDLLPSQAVQLDRSRVLGFCLAEGGPTSHVAILARGLGLPAVVGLGSIIANLTDEMLLAVDGTAGTVLVDPDQQTTSTFEAQIAATRLRNSEARAAARSPVVTRDGAALTILANISSPGEGAAAVDCGAEGVGLLRTELLFVERNTPPSEEEQLNLYRLIAAALDGRPLVIRTLDIGGDKPVRYLRQPPEQNPALGARGIRLARSAPDLLRAQVRAIWRIGPNYPIKVMFPMVANLEEVYWLRRMVAEVGDELRAAGELVVDQLEVGVMIEVPALALVADHVARLVDFMSIGTNDLTQYALAVDRTNAAVSGIGDSLHPAVLRLIAQTARAGASGDAVVSVCGELAGDPLGALALVGLGVTTLSMSGPLIPAAKAALRAINLAEVQVAAQQILDLSTAAEVRARLRMISAG